MEILLPPLAQKVHQLFKDAKEIIIVSPWIKYEALQWVINSDERNKPPDIRVLMVGAFRDFVSGASDIEVVKWLLEAEADLRLVSNLHAKIYVADESQAIVTSANLTAPGFGFSHSNVEIGTLIDDSKAILKLKSVIEDWFAQGRKVDDTWLDNMQAQIKTNSIQGIASTIQVEEQKLKKLGRKLSGKQIQIAKPSKIKPRKKGVGLSSDGIGVETILTTMFSSRIECQAGIDFFVRALASLPPDKDFQHIISTTYRYPEQKLTLNIGNWEVFCFLRKRQQLFVTFCVDRQLLSDTNEVIGLTRTSQLGPRWSGDGSYGFIQVKWNYPFKQSDKFFEAWYNCIQHTAKTFGAWKASTFMHYHRQDILDLFIEDSYREAVLKKAFSDE